MERQVLEQLKEVNINQRNKMVNTEKPQSKAEKLNKQAKQVVGTMQSKAQGAPIKDTVSKKPQASESSDSKSNQDNKLENKVTESLVKKSEVKPKEEKKPAKPKIKKSEAVINVTSLPISTKTSVEISYSHINRSLA